MSEFARTLKHLADVCGKSENRTAQLSGLAPTFVRRLFEGMKNASRLTIIRLTVGLATDSKLAETHPTQVPFIPNALHHADRSDAIDNTLGGTDLGPLAGLQQT